MARKIVHHELSAELVEIDVAKATKLLESNLSNRPLRTTIVNRYMNQMLMGQWRRALPPTIILDKFGNVHNGQHTLNALVGAEQYRLEDPEWCKKYGTDKKPITIMAVVVKGIEPEDADLLDVGQKRTHGDMVYRQKHFEKIEGLSDGDKKRIASLMGTAAKIVFFRTVYGKKVRATNKFEHADLCDTEAKHSGLLASAVFVFNTDKQSRPDGKGTGGIAARINLAYVIAAHYLAWHSDAEADAKGHLTGKRRALADEFVESLAEGIPADSPNPKSHPVHVLREWLVSTKANGNRDGNALYDAIVVAWNAFVEEKGITAKEFKVREDAYPQMGGVDVPPPIEEEEEVDSELVWSDEEQCYHDADGNPYDEKGYPLVYEGDAAELETAAAE